MSYGTEEGRRYALESFPENYQLYAHHTGDQRRDLYLVGEPYLAVRRAVVSVVVSCYLSSPTQAQNMFPGSVLPTSLFPTRFG